MLTGIDIDVAVCESVALTGESGSGKSTLLHLAGGLDHADSGLVVMIGKDLAFFDDGERCRYRERKLASYFSSLT